VDERKAGFRPFAEPDGNYTVKQDGVVSEIHLVTQPKAEAWEGDPPEKPAEHYPELSKGE
jgi:hypothetical protein